MLGLIFNGSTATRALRRSTARTPPDSGEDDELNDALLQFGIHVSAGGNAGVGDDSGVGNSSRGGTSNGGDHVPPTNRGGVIGGNHAAPTNKGVVIGGDGLAKYPMDNSSPNLDSKRKGKGKESSSSMDSLRSDALKEICDLSRLRREILIQD